MQYFWKEQDDIPAGMGYPIFGAIHILSVVITLLFVFFGLKVFLQLGSGIRKRVLKAIPVIMLFMEVFKDCFLIRVHRFRVVGLDTDLSRGSALREGPRSGRTVIGVHVLGKDLERVFFTDGQAPQRDRNRLVCGLLENEIVGERVGAGIVAVPVLRGRNAVHRDRDPGIDRDRAGERRVGEVHRVVAGQRAGI